MQFTTALILTSLTAVLAKNGDGSGMGTGMMSVSAASSWITGYSVSGSSMYPITGLVTKTKGSEEMTTTGVPTYSMGMGESESESHKGMNSTMSMGKMSTATAASAVTTSTTVAKATTGSTTTAAAASQVTTNAGAAMQWSAAAGLVAIAGLVMA